MTKGPKRIIVKEADYKEKYSAEEWRSLIVSHGPNGSFKKEPPPEKGNLYKNKIDYVVDPETGNEIRFQSMREANYFRALLTARTAIDPSSRVVKIERQKMFRIEMGGRKITKLILDFVITYGDGTIRYVDTKGYRNPKAPVYQLFRIKKEIVEVMYGIMIELA